MRGSSTVLQQMFDPLIKTLNKFHDEIGLVGCLEAVDGQLAHHPQAKQSLLHGGCHSFRIPSLHLTKEEGRSFRSTIFIVS